MILKVKWKFIYLKGRFNGNYCEDIDTEKVYWVSPSYIKYISKETFSVRKSKGHIIDGRWDISKDKFEELDVYQAFKLVGIEGRPWQETVYYQRIVKRLEQGQILWGCTSKDDFDKRCVYLERLFNSIKENGYKSQAELKSCQASVVNIKSARAFDVWEKTCPDNEVSVSIGREGNLLFCDGAHRLAIAKLLNIKQIPVRIVVRHPEWISFRKEAQLYAEELGGRTYQPFLHPDLDHIEYNHDCLDRLEIIRKHIGLTRGSVLDIGANLGFFCFRLEAEGFDCYAVEDSQINLLFLEKIKKALHAGFNIITESVLSSREVLKGGFDIVLALNIFHHFLKEKETYGQLIRLLKSLKPKEMFFESHLFDESQMEGAYRNYSPDEFVEFIKEHSGLRNSQFLFKAEDGRSLYKIF